MGAPINLDILDTPILEQTKFGPDMQRWLPNIVDSINSNATTIQDALANLIFISQQDIGGSGAGPVVVTVTGLMASNFVSVNLVSTTNPGVTITNVTVSVGSFSVTFSSDPGASAIIAWQAFVSQPQ